MAIEDVPVLATILGGGVILTADTRKPWRANSESRAPSAARAGAREA
jgi:hypothetical protein